VARKIVRSLCRIGITRFLFNEIFLGSEYILSQELCKRKQEGFQEC
jgi:hypothetical protein